MTKSGPPQVRATNSKSQQRRLQAALRTAPCCTSYPEILDVLRIGRGYVSFYAKNDSFTAARQWKKQQSLMDTRVGRYSSSLSGYSLSRTARWDHRYPAVLRPFWPAILTSRISNSWCFQIPYTSSATFWDHPCAAPSVRRMDGGWC